MTDVQLSSRVEQVEAASLIAQLQKVPVFAGVSFEGLSCLGTVEPEPLSLFDHVYAEPDALVEQERADYAQYLAGFEDEGETA